MSLFLWDILYYGTGMASDNEIFFHGDQYSEGPWGNTSQVCCRLCKTKNSEGRYKHWAKGLCRSCYRRLSVTHRLYNDRWGKAHSKTKKPRKTPNSTKRYKKEDPVNLIFDDFDVETLLDRYSWRCAYSGEPLQGYDHRKGNAFQLEYRIDEENKAFLVPVCRKINCSKKGLTSQEDLRKWA